MRSWLAAAFGVALLTFAGPALAQPRALCSANTVHIKRITVTLLTGGDDLRGGNDQVFGQFWNAGGLTPKTSLNRGARWQGGSRHAYVFDFPGCGMAVRHLRFFRLSTNFRGGFDGDNWDLNEVELVWEGTDARGRRRVGDLGRAHGYPLKRFTASENMFNLALRRID